MNDSLAIVGDHSPPEGNTPPPVRWDYAVWNTQVISLVLIGLLGLLILSILIASLWLTKHTFYRIHKRRTTASGSLWINTHVIPISTKAGFPTRQQHDAPCKQKEESNVGNRNKLTKTLMSSDPWETEADAECPLVSSVASLQQAVIAGCPICQLEKLPVHKSRVPAGEVPSPTPGPQIDNDAESSTATGETSLSSAFPSSVASIEREVASSSSMETPSECSWIHLSCGDHDLGHTRIERAPVVTELSPSCEGFMMLKVITM